MCKKLLLVLLSLLVLVGCGKSAAGTYTASGPAGSLELDIKGDKTYEGKAGPGGSPEFSGTWEQSGNSLDMKMTVYRGRDIPNGMPNQTKTGTLSADGKQLTIDGEVFTKK